MLYVLAALRFEVIEGMHTHGLYFFHLAHDHEKSGIIFLGNRWSAYLPRITYVGFSP